MQHPGDRYHVPLSPLSGIREKDDVHFDDVSTDERPPLQRKERELVLVNAVKVVSSSLLLGISVTCLAQESFQPSAHFAGSTLADWKSVGKAQWRTQGGEIIGTASSGGGFLLHKGDLQDIQLLLNYECEGECEAGVLSRMETTAGGGMTGILTLLSKGDLDSYQIDFDSEGNETGRSKLPVAPSPFAPPARPPGDASGAAGAAKPPSAPPALPAGFVIKKPTLKPTGEWNTEEVLVSDKSVKAVVNSVSTSEMVTATVGFGSFGFYTKGPGTVHFRNIAWKDLNQVSEPRDKTSPHFTKQQVSQVYYGWDASVADIDHDGHLDIVSGPFYYSGPDFTTRHRYREGRAYNPSIEYAPDMINFAADFSGDGWPDILASDLTNGASGPSRPLDLYVNPKGEPRRWNKYRVIPKISTELVLMRDIDGDGHPEIIFGGDGRYSYAKPDPADITKPWVLHPISAPGVRVNIHGLGVGDVNGDGLQDVVIQNGWFEHPKNDSGQPWTFHEANFGSGGAEMGVYDVNGDGLNDIVASLEAHGFGLAWFEQKRDSQGNITFVQHPIAGDYSAKNAGDVTFSQPHASRFADMDGDGIPDFIVGKSVYHHLEDYEGDPDLYGPAVLYVYRTVRNPKAPGGAEFIPEMVSNHSGVGSSFEVIDLNKDGKMDIVTQSSLGTFVFLGNDKRWPPAKAK